MIKYLRTKIKTLFTLFKISKYLNFNIYEAALVVDRAKRVTTKSGQPIANSISECYQIVRVAVRRGTARDYTSLQSIDFAFNAISRCDPESFEALGFYGVKGGCDGNKVWNRLNNIREVGGDE